MIYYSSIDNLIKGPKNELEKSVHPIRLTYNNEKKDHKDF